MQFTELMATNPPRLVVIFNRLENGNENFEWGVVGEMPVLDLIGNVDRVQRNALGRDSEEYVEIDGRTFQVMRPVAFERLPDNYPTAALAMLWDNEDRRFTNFLHPSIPTRSLCGYLEVVKSNLVMSRVAQHMGSQVRALQPSTDHGANAVIQQAMRTSKPFKMRG